MSSEQGSATLWMLAVVVSSMLLAALVLDGGAILRVRSDAFAAAGAAARAGAQELDPDEAVEGRTELDVPAARRTALDHLAADGFTGTVSIAGDSISVTARGSAELQLLRLAGGRSTTFEATATAVATKVGSP